MSTSTFLPIHLIDVEGCGIGKGQEITEIIIVRLLCTMSVCVIFHGNPSSRLTCLTKSQIYQPDSVRGKVSKTDPPVELTVMRVLSVVKEIFQSVHKWRTD